MSRKSASCSGFVIVSSLSPKKIEFAPAMKHNICASRLKPTRPADKRTRAVGITIRAVAHIRTISNGSIGAWIFKDGEETVEAAVSGPLIAHDYSTLLAAAIRGVGLAQVPEPIARAPIAEGRLLSVMERYAAATPVVFLYHPGRRQVLPKLRAFIERRAPGQRAADQLEGRAGVAVLVVGGVVG